MQQGPRVAVIGLDCGTPQLLFRDLHAEVPNIRKLMGAGMYGDLASITPPITVPAWACAMTGKTPGQLGIYGFRNRKDTPTTACRSRTPVRSRSRPSGTSWASRASDRC